MSTYLLAAANSFLSLLRVAFFRAAPSARAPVPLYARASLGPWLWYMYHDKHKCDAHKISEPCVYTGVRLRQVLFF